MLRQAVEQLAASATMRGLPGQHHHIDVGQIGRSMAETFPHRALDAVAVNRAFGATLGNGQA